MPRLFHQTWRYLSMLIGILGGGQLGMMLGEAGRELGLYFRFLDRSPDSPARRVGSLITGSYEDHATLNSFAAGLDALTYEFENVPTATVRHFEEAGIPVFPSSQALATCQDRVFEKSLFRDLNIPCAPWVAVSQERDIISGIEQVGLPAVLKTRRFGYDGKGQAWIRSHTDIASAWRAVAGAPSVLEGAVEFRRELSIIATRHRTGDMALYPLTENTHRQGILRVSRAPAEGGSAHAAHAIASTLLRALNYVGTLAVELFELPDGRLLANEMAPRVHNSGHWTIEGAATSQFENHLRAQVAPDLGSTELIEGEAVMLNFIGSLPMGDTCAELMRRGASFHDYGKRPAPGRKVGHATLVGPAARLPLPVEWSER